MKKVFSFASLARGQSEEGFMAVYFHKQNKNPCLPILLSLTGSWPSRASYNQPYMMGEEPMQRHASTTGRGPAASKGRAQSTNEASEWFPSAADPLITSIGRG